jgi:beta-glucosidase
MSAHLLIPAWDAELPATLSQKILTGQLRQRLGFDGLVVTDALVMGAIANRYGLAEASVLAVEAGADILLMPLDAEVTIKAVCDAVSQGRISESRIDESWERIKQVKAKVYPQTKVEQISLPIYELPQKLNRPLAQKTVVEILQASLRIGGSLTPQTDAKCLRNLVVVEDILNNAFLGNQTPAIAIPKKFGYQPLVIDSNSEIPQSSITNRLTLLQLFIRGNPFGKLSRLTQASLDLLKRLLRNSELQALVIYGSQYTLEQFLPDLPSEIPYIFCYGQMPKAQTVAMELLFKEFSKSF